MTTAVRRQSKARLAARLVLLTLADYAGEDGTAWPAVATLATDTLLGITTVHTALANLVDIGELVVERNAGPRGCNLYRITLTPADSAPSRIGRGADSGPLPNRVEGVPIRADTPTDSAPEPLENHQGTIPPPPPTVGEAVVGEIDVPGITARVQAARQAAGLPIARWRDRDIAKALSKALVDGRPLAALEPALTAMAVNRTDRADLPGRLVAPGPWWDIGHVVDLDAHRSADLPFCETHHHRGKICRGCAADRKAGTA